MADASYSIKFDDQVSKYLEGLRTSNDRRVRWIKIGAIVSIAHMVVLAAWLAVAMVRW
jgi:hypothetical protein